MYQRTINDEEKAKTSRTPVFPAVWHNQFGLLVEEHRRLLQVNIFDGYTIFGIKDNPVTAPADNLQAVSNNDLWAPSLQ
jgi:hypothetical protein